MGMRHTVDRASTLSPTLSLQFSFHTSWNLNTCFFQTRRTRLTTFPKPHNICFCHRLVLGSVVASITCLATAQTCLMMLARHSYGSTYLCSDIVLATDMPAGTTSLLAFLSTM